MSHQSDWIYYTLPIKSLVLKVNDMQEDLILTQFYKRGGSTVNPLLSPPGGLFFSSTFDGGLNRDGGLKREGGGGLFNSAKHITCSKNTMVSDRVDLCVVQFKSLSKVCACGSLNVTKTKFLFFKNVLSASCSSVIFMKMVTCIDLSYATYKRTSVENFSHI